MTIKNSVDFEKCCRRCLHLVGGPSFGGPVIEPCVPFCTDTNLGGPYLPFLPSPIPILLLLPWEVLEHTQVEKNVFRWVVYVVWLTGHPHACHWYRKIEKERPHLVPSMFTLLFWCGVAWLRGKRRSPK